MKKGIKTALRLFSFATITSAVFLTGFIGKLTQSVPEKTGAQDKLGPEGLFSVVNVPTALADAYGSFGGCGGYVAGSGSGGCGTSDGGGSSSASASCGGAGCAGGGSGDGDGSGGSGDGCSC